MLQSLFIRLAVFVWEGEPGKKVTATLRRSSSKGLGTSEVKIAIAVIAFAVNKMASKKKGRPIAQNLFTLLEIGVWSKQMFFPHARQ